MKKFQILRYFRTFKILIIACVLLGGLVVYNYANSHQVYTASMILKYCNSEAADGYTPAGTKLDVSEIYSTAVVTDAIRALGITTSVESIRSNISVEEIIPEDEQIKKDALLSKGEEYIYNPVMYKVTFTADSSKSRNYARDVLDAVINSYYSYYGAKYVDYVVFPNNASNVSLDEYDYINCAEMLDNSCSEIISYLDLRAGIYPGFRSTESGYGFKDLLNTYEYVQNTDIAEIFATVFDLKPVQDRRQLIARYQNELNKDAIELANYEKEADELWRLIEQFGKKTLSGSDYSFSGDSPETEGLIVNGIYSGFHGTPEGTTTTYDKLIYKYSSVCSQKAELSRNIERYQFYLNLFDDPEAGGNVRNVNSADLRALIESTSAKMNDLYAIVQTTIDEFNEYNCARNVIPLTSINTYEKINITLYTVLALVVMLIFGCGFAVFLGRMGDFVYYFLYVDKKTGLPNRSSCDVFISEYENVILPEDFSCIAMRVRFPKDGDAGGRRTRGDEMLKAFGEILKKTLEGSGFVGYNDGGNFIAFLDDTSYEKACAFKARIESEIGYNNSNDEAVKIAAEYGISASTADKIYDIRGLLRSAMQKIGGKNESKR